MKTSSTAFVVVLSALCLSSTARADAPDLLTLGRQEYEAGTTEFDLGHYEKALEHFEASYRMTGKPALLYNIGYVDKQLFLRTRNLERLRQGIDRLTAYLQATEQDVDPGVVALRARVQKELSEASAQYQTELARVAKGEETLELGERLLRDGNFDEATAQLEKFERTPGNERAGVVRAFLLRGSIAAQRADSAAAVDAYERALSLDHAASLGSAPPPAAKSAFEEARHRVGGLEVARVGHTPPGSVKAGAGVELLFMVRSDPKRLLRGLTVFYRSTGGGAFSTVLLPFDSHFATVTSPTITRVNLPSLFSGGLLPGSKVEYYANATDANGAILDHLGTAALPFAVQVERPVGPSVVRRWWFWTGAGGVVAAAALGIGLGLYFTQPPAPTYVPINLGLKQR